MRKIILILGLFISVGLQAQTTTTNAQIRTTNYSWDDVMVAFETGVNGASGYPAFNIDSLTYSFVIDSTGPTVCAKYFNIEMPHFYTTGTAIHPHIHYRYTTGQGTPTFVLKYKWFNLGTKKATAFSELILNSNVLGVAGNYTNVILEDTGDIGIDGTGMSFGSTLQCYLYLRTTSGVTKTCDVYQFGIHIQKDGLGSRLEYTK